MTAHEIMAALRPILGDELRLSIQLTTPGKVDVTIDSDEPGRLIGFVDFPSLAFTLGVDTKNVTSKVITTSVWSENDKRVVPHYEIELCVRDVACDDFE